MKDILGQPAREALGETARQCTSATHKGGRCKRAPIVGGFVCHIHGGGKPEVRRTARERLLAMVDPALDALLRMLRAAPPCPACGRSDADRDPVVLRAAQIVLDRTGFHPTLAVAEAPAVPPYFRWIPADRLAQMQAWMAEAELAMRRGDTPGSVVTALPAAEPDVFDAELIPEEDNGYDPLG